MISPEQKDKIIEKNMMLYLMKCEYTDLFSGVLSEPEIKKVVNNAEQRFVELCL